MTWNRTLAYQDADTLWRDTLAKNPGAWIAHNNLGFTDLTRGNTKAAIEHFQQALKFNPDCTEARNNLGIAFQKKIGVGLFGGEGFIMQRLTGDGWTFVHAGGTVIPKELGPGELLRVDTGCIVAFQPTVQYDIQFVGKVKSALFGGEGLFFATLRGPGYVWLQSLPFSRLADRVISASSRGGGGKDEGSVLGGLGRLLDGDN